MIMSTVYLENILTITTKLYADQKRRALENHVLCKLSRRGIRYLDYIPRSQPRTCETSQNNNFFQFVFYNEIL